MPESMVHVSRQSRYTTTELQNEKEGEEEGEKKKKEKETEKENENEQEEEDEVEREQESTLPLLRLVVHPKVYAQCSRSTCLPRLV